jgi:hypothetical protein
VGRLGSCWYLELWRDGHVRDAETIRGYDRRADAQADGSSHEATARELTTTYRLSELAAWSVLRRSRERGSMEITPEDRGSVGQLIERWQIRLDYTQGEGWKLTELAHETGAGCCPECEGSECQ